MSAEITISIRLFVLLMAIFAWGILDRILIASSRWFIRRRINRLIDEISTRLERPQRFLEVENLANRLMGAIRRVVPALPVSLVASVMLEAPPAGLRAAKVQERVTQYAADIQRRGAWVYLSPRNPVESILSALNMLQSRKLVWVSEGRYRVVSDEKIVLAYYANAIAHWRRLSSASDN